MRLQLTPICRPKLRSTSLLWAWVFISHSCIAYTFPLIPLAASNPALVKKEESRPPVFFSLSSITFGAHLAA
ncbi:hypothetical protein SAMN05216403_1288 [Nitrosospira multiformis ATCC 25196]|uniref:Uncharacterized protein n=1 Tax=Nitrosospira multiformis (strain ATCC 25196 / NCIMB 11849 / C 71) TaxID=323848 RepID=A0A1H5XA81_NITMU|nr:hypothetical protein SAMN05216403_1288 [Nitrosospira multiformis ATCC 25196]